MEAPLQPHGPGGAADAAEVAAGLFVQVGDAWHGEEGAGHGSAVGAARHAHVHLDDEAGSSNQLQHEMTCSNHLDLLRIT